MPLEWVSRRDTRAFINFPFIKFLFLDESILLFPTYVGEANKIFETCVL